MRNDNLTSATVYLTQEEYQALKEEAEDHDVSISAAIRSKMKLPRIEPHKQKSTKRSKPAKKAE